MFFIVTFHQIVFYSLCFGRSWLLIHLMLKLIAVGVALGGLAARFNTSHVKVNLTNNIIKQHDPVSFNTSHVKVNQSCTYNIFNFREVSIHPMLKLIQRISCIPYNTLYQIPQYLSTFLKFLPATAPFAKKIYKITAMPLFLRIHAILH